MNAWIGLCLALSAAGGSDRSTLIAGGGDLARGVLYNRTPGAGLRDAPNPGRPTFVFVHGFNPLPHAIHFEMAERFGEAVGRRMGIGACNVLDWDWNGATFVGIYYARNTEAAVQQGPLLADAIVRAGLDPGRVHLIGHSYGAIVAASAARVLTTKHGVPAAQLTLLEAAGFCHEIVFDRLGAGTACGRVENYYTPGPSGYGRITAVPGVINVRLPARNPVVGIVLPSHSGHVDMVRWYIGTALEPRCPLGFNASVLLR